MYIRYGTKDQAALTSKKAPKPTEHYDHGPIVFESDPEVVASHAKFGKRDLSSGKRPRTSKASGRNTSAEHDVEMAPARGKKRTSGDTEVGPSGSSREPANKRQRRAPTYKTAAAKPISRYEDECTPADRKLIEWRESGIPWPEIRRQYAKFTGEELTAPSTLPNRYNRLKSNFSSVSPDDEAKLMRIKLEVDADFERKRWDIVADRMANSGAQKYQPTTLSYAFKKLMLRADHLKLHGTDPGNDGVDVPREQHQDGDDEGTETRTNGGGQEEDGSNEGDDEDADGGAEGESYGGDEDEDLDAPEASC